jgi:hypothetical protein
MPQVYVSLVITVGLITLICFISYNKWMIRESLILKPKETVDTGIWTKPITAGVALLFIPITIGAAFIGGPFHFFGGDEAEEVVLNWNMDYDTITDPLLVLSEYSDENSDSDHTITLPKDDANNLIKVTFKLTWEDEVDSSIRYTNQPDTFSMTIYTPDPDNQTIESITSEAGVITVEYELFPNRDPPTKDPYFNGTGDYIVTISCGDCGDQKTTVSILGLRDIADTGNAWDLEVTYNYYLKKEQ